MTTVTIPELHVGRGVQVGPLTVFPVWTSTPSMTGLVTGTDATIEVAERDGSPVVAELIVTNVGEQPALLLEGELLEGGWQHRTLLHDVILRPSRTMVASVACVEAGRWHGGATHARRARRASGGIRASMNTGDPARRQQAVWSRVSAYDRAMGASHTSSYLDHLDGMATGALLASPPILDGQRGVIVGLGGQPVLLEVFPCQDALASALPSLLAGLMVDAVSSGAPDVITPGRRARRMVERLDGRRTTRARGVDAGDAVPLVLETEYAALHGVTLDEEWAHLSAFNRRHPLVAV